ncbi:MAG: protein-export chaperone SecB [Rhodospirillaceae bacterium]
MTTTPAQPADGAAKPNGSNGAGDNQPHALPISVLAQYLKDLSFENPRAPQSLMAGQPAPDVAVHIDIKTGTPADGVHEVALTLRVEAKAGQDVVFLVEVTYAGLFQLTGVPPEHHGPILVIEGPRLLFPFARNIIAEAIRAGGFPQLLINPIDFAELYRRQQAK